MSITPKPAGNVVDYFSGTGSGTGQKLSGYWKSLSVINTGGADLTLTVNGLAITVQNGETFDDNFEDFNEFEITASGAWRIVLRG